MYQKYQNPLYTTVKCQIHKYTCLPSVHGSEIPEHLFTVSVRNTSNFAYNQYMYQKYQNTHVLSVSEMQIHLPTVSTCVKIPKSLCIVISGTQEPSPTIRTCIRNTRTLVHGWCQKHKYPCLLSVHCTDAQILVSSFQVWKYPCLPLEYVSEIPEPLCPVSVRNTSTLAYYQNIVLIPEPDTRLFFFEVQIKLCEC